MLKHIAALLLFALAASAGASAADLSNIKSVGVISAIGDRLHHAYIGSTAFTNKDSDEDMSDWTLDEFVLAEFSAQLAGRVEVKPVTYNKSDFYPDTGGIIVHADLDVPARVNAIKPADGSGPDAYIVVSNTMNDDFVGGTNQHLLGAGLYRHHGLFGGNMDAVYVSAIVTIVDARSGKELDSIVMLMGEGGFFSRSPLHQMVKDLWEDHFIMLTDKRAEALEAFKSILHQGVALSLRRLELLPKQ